MGRLACACLAGLFLSAWASSADFRGRMLLKDASNGDRTVGSAPKDGIPQGHALKVVLQGVRFGRRPAAGAALEVDVQKGSDPVAHARTRLDDKGYGEVLIPIEDVWFGLHHVRAKVSTADSGRSGGSGGSGQLEREFRVIEGEPSPDIPYGLPAVLLAVAAVMLAIRWTRAQPTAS